MNLDKEISHDNTISPEFIAPIPSLVYILGSTVLFSQSSSGLSGMLQFNHHSIPVIALILAITVALGAFLILSKTQGRKLNYYVELLAHMAFLFAFLNAALSIFSTAMVGYYAIN